MAIYKLFPEKDATLYTQNVTMNTGLDEILEASTYILNDAAQTSRYLIKFSQNEINNAYTSYISGSGISYLSTANGNLNGSITLNPTDLVDKVYYNVPFTSSLNDISLFNGNSLITLFNDVICFLFLLIFIINPIPQL